jgi:hypothetical protein
MLSTKAWRIKHILPEIGKKKQLKRLSVTLPHFNVEQDSGLSMADFEFFYGKMEGSMLFLVTLGESTVCIVEEHFNRT